MKFYKVTFLRQGETSAVETQTLLKFNTRTYLMTAAGILVFFVINMIVEPQPSTSSSWLVFVVTRLSVENILIFPSLVRDQLLGWFVG